MKPVIAYIVIYVGTFIASVLLVFLIYKTKPSLFVGASKHRNIESTEEMADSSMYSDTTEVAQQGAPDSAAVPTKRNGITTLQDSIKTLVSLLAVEAEKTKQLENSKKFLSQPTAKEPEKVSDSKAMAKMLDGIKSEQAVKIINNLSDKEVRELFPLLNKRQASKILSALDPSRAARLIR